LTVSKQDETDQIIFLKNLQVFSSI